MSAYDCGHVCCDERANAMHHHVLRSLFCKACNRIEAAANLLADKLCEASPETVAAIVGERTMLCHGCGTETVVLRCGCEFPACDRYYCVQSHHLIRSDGCHRPWTVDHDCFMAAAVEAAAEIVRPVEPVGRGAGRPAGRGRSDVVDAQYGGLNNYDSGDGSFRVECVDAVEASPA